MGGAAGCGRPRRPALAKERYARTIKNEVGIRTYSHANVVDGERSSATGHSHVRQCGRCRRSSCLGAATRAPRTGDRLAIDGPETYPYVAVVQTLRPPGIRGFTPPDPWERSQGGTDCHGDKLQ